MPSEHESRHDAVAVPSRVPDPVREALRGPMDRFHSAAWCQLHRLAGLRGTWFSSREVNMTRSYAEPSVSLATESRSWQSSLG